MWRKLAAQWSIGRDKLQVLKERCLSQFLLFVNDHLQQLPTTIDADMVSEQGQLSEETVTIKRDCSQPASKCLEQQPEQKTQELPKANKMSLLVQPGAAFEEKF